MKVLQVSARFRIHDGKLDEFKTQAQACIQSVREKDTGTMQYDWFFNSDETECVVRERYASSEAIIAHIGNLGETFGGLLATADIALEIYGEPSAELVAATEGLPTEVYGFFKGI